MTTIFYEDDADKSLIAGRKVAVLGYGSQGHAHSLNLRDSGVDVRVGLRPDSASRRQAEEEGLRVVDTLAAAEEADVVVVLVPDQHQKGLWEQGLSDTLKDGDMLLFGHGFSVHFGFIKPSPGIDVTMVAPKSPGHIVRRLYAEGQGVPGLVAVQQDATGSAHQLALSYASAIGCTRAGVLETTFEEETVTDLFGEQTVLCGGVTQLIQSGFKVLTEAGYKPEAAYFECLHELKLIVDLIYEGGLAGMRYSISDTAEYGDYTRGPRVVDEHATEAMREILSEIQDGTFAREWMDEWESGGDKFRARRNEEADAPIEQVGKSLREMMPWMAQRR